MQNMQYKISAELDDLSLGSAYRFSRAHGVCSQLHIMFMLIEEMCKVESHLMMLQISKRCYPQQSSLSN